MNSVFDIRRNCVRIKADIKGWGMKFKGSGVLYPLGTDAGYDYVLTAQHILKDADNEKLNSQLEKIKAIEIDISEGGSFIPYKIIAKEDIESSLLTIGDDFLIIKVAKGEKEFVPFYLADDLIEEKPMQLYGVSSEAQNDITRLDCKCVDKDEEKVNITTAVDDMYSLHGMSGGGVFAMNQPLMYGVLWKYAATDGEFHNVKISQALEEQISEQLTARGWNPIGFINISQCKKAMYKVYDDVFHDINDTILVNRNNAKFPLEDRFVMPDFVSEVQGFNDEEAPVDKKIKINPTNIYIKGGEIQEYREQYLEDLYSQLNATGIREMRIPATSILNTDRRILLIVGGPGSGKSSLLKYLTLRLLKGTFPAYDGYLPVWMPFSYMAKNSDCEVKEIIQTWLQDRKLWEKYNHYLEYAFEQQKVLLIADGIDEWGDEPLQADKVIRKVKAESEAGNLLAFFSSREYGIANINSPFSAVDTYTIAPLSASQQKELVEKCVNHYNGLLPEIQHTAVFLTTKLRMLKDVDRMKENPMLLTVLVSQYLQGNELPHNNIAAMECVVEQLFVKHQQSRKYEAYDYSGSFDYTNNKMMLGVLSKEMFDYYNDGCIDKTQAEVLLNQYLNSQANGKELGNARIVDELFRHDTHQLGVLEERSGSRISFINRQIQEFMTAKYLSVDKNRAKEFIREHATDSGLHQVVLFLFEMMPASSFVSLYNEMKLLEVHDYKGYYLYKLKLEVLIRSVKAPSHFLLDEIETFVQRIENESDYDIKHDLLEILLDGLYNPSLVERIDNFIARYVPAASVYHDVRLSGLMQVDKLTEAERQFVVHTVVNGDVNNKLLASNVIRKHILDDEELLKMVNSYILPSTMPEVVAFFIRSVIVEGLDVEKENELIQRIIPCEIFTRFYQMEFSLHKGDAVSVEDVINVVSEWFFSLNEEAARVLLKYYAQNEDVRLRAIKSINAKFREYGNMGRDLAWRYLLSCWINHPDVINAITEQLKEEFPFNIGNSYELWAVIQKQELAPVLLHIITEWAVERFEKHKWGVESILVNTIAKDERIKEKLLATLDTQESWLHVIVHPLMKNWGDDADVIARLQRYLDEEEVEKSSWMADYAYEIYKGDDIRIKAFLDKCLEAENADLQKPRAIYVYIRYYKEEFAEKYIHRVLNDEIPMGDKVLGSKWGFLEAIIDNYPERKDVLEYLQRNYSEDYRFAGQIIVKYHGSELASKMLSKWYHMDARLRLMMIHKVSALSSIDERIEKILHSFKLEGNAFVLCDTVLCLVDHLKRAGRDEDVFKIADEVFDTTPVTTEYAYKIRLCIYLLYQRIEDYVQLDMKRVGGKEYEFALTHLFYNDSPYIEKTFADQADYLLSDNMANLKKLVKKEESLYSYIVFFSKYVNPTSGAANVLVNYISENKDKVDDANILMFLKRMEGQKQLLKELVINNIDNENNEMTASVAQIIATEFESDEEIMSLLSLDEWKVFESSFSRISLNCSLNTNKDKLQKIYYDLKDKNYPLNRTFASYNFIISQADVNELIKRLKHYLTELSDTFVSRLIIVPLISRLKSDQGLVERLYEELLNTDDPRIRVGIYSILSSAGVKSAELRDWRDHQKDNLFEYGHDMMQNRDRQLVVTMQ